MQGLGLRQYFGSHVNADPDPDHTRKMEKKDHHENKKSRTARWKKTIRSLKKTWRKTEEMERIVGRITMNTNCR
jgi:hypothetical protein